MTTTILAFHPDPQASRANRALAEAAASVPGVEVVHMGEVYPEGSIDLDAEVRRLLAVQRLVLQFPIHWYAAPPLLKAWQDAVLTRMYYLAMETEGARLRDLPVLVAVTAGNDPQAYTDAGVNGFSIRDLLNPLRATAHRCAWRWHEPFVVYRANRLSDDDLAAQGLRYAGHLGSWA